MSLPPSFNSYHGPWAIFQLMFNDHHPSPYVSFLICCVLLICLWMKGEILIEISCLFFLFSLEVEGANNIRWCGGYLGQESCRQGRKRGWRGWEVGTGKRFCWTWVCLAGYMDWEVGLPFCLDFSKFANSALLLFPGDECRSSRLRNNSYASVIFAWP